MSGRNIGNNGRELSHIEQGVSAPGTTGFVPAERSLKMPEEVARGVDSGSSIRHSAVGAIDNAVEYFEQQKADIRERLGDISSITLMLNRVWVAIWVRPNFKDLGGGKKLYRTDDTVAEDEYQGNTAMIVAVGPMAFAVNPHVDFGPSPPKVGDWVLYSRHAAGMRFKHNGVHCTMLETETPIKAILSRPDLVE